MSEIFIKGKFLNLDIGENRGNILVLYQYEKFLSQKKPEKDVSKWESKFGCRVLKRDSSGKAQEVEVRCLIDNPNNRVFLVGEFNNWGKDAIDLENYEFKHDKDSVFGRIVTDKLSHKTQYKFLVKQNSKWFFIQDPAGVYFDDLGNSIFWDFDDKKCYKPKYDFIDTINRSCKVMQTDLPGLITHWQGKDGVMGRDIDEKDYYSFIADSGVIKHIKSLGFNTIQFLPFAQSIDGTNWKYRYLVPFQYAVQKNWGSPDEFARMVDMFHKEGISVIGDFVLGHLPHKDFGIFGQSFKDHGIHQWENRHGVPLYLKEETAWGTMRVDFDNSYVRDFFVESCIHFMKYYRVDGFRIDNVDGIIRYGPNGDGDERPNGRTFLRELNKEIYSYNHFALIHYEAHYYHEDNAKMLVVPFEEDDRALGATAYNSSRVTYYMHTEYMPKDVKKVTPWKFKDITEEKEWGQSSSTIADFHNHDAAAGLMEMRCTGSYAYDTMTIKQPANHIHAVGKIKVMEAIISFACEGRTLDLLQTFLLQTGTFEHDASVHWFLTFNQANNNVVEYKKRVNEIMDSPSFWPMNTKNRKFLNVDDENKILVVERSAVVDGKEEVYVIVINLSAWTHQNYKVGVKSAGKYSCELNSDLFDYAGFGVISYSKELQSVKSKNFELLDQEINLSVIAPYGVVVLKKN